MRRANAITVAPSETPDWLTTPIEFEDQRKIRSRRNSMRIVVALVVGVLPGGRSIRSFAPTPVDPVEVRPVQHLEGGIVDQILVKEGQLVDKGQPLMRLQPAGTESELAALRVRAHNLMLEKARAQALLANRDVDSHSLGEISADLIADHVRVHQMRLEQRAKERDLLATRIAQRKAEIAGLQTQIPMQNRLVDMQKERLEGRQKLYAHGAMSKKQVLEVEAGYEQARIQLHESERKLAMAKEALPEAEAALAEADAQARKLWSEELAKASSELAEVQQSIKKLADRFDRLVVCDSAVQDMLQRSPGEVASGRKHCEYRPGGDDLAAEVRVKPEDIAEVKAGDRADVKVSAFDYSRYGKV
jgi:HlyD family secretion protein/adhesin transport system membrane fusion protein